jgi:hypothetical protein
VRLKWRAGGRHEDKYEFKADKIESGKLSKRSALADQDGPCSLEPYLILGLVGVKPHADKRSYPVSIVKARSILDARVCGSILRLETYSRLES